MSVDLLRTVFTYLVVTEAIVLTLANLLVIVLYLRSRVLLHVTLLAFSYVGLLATVLAAFLLMEASSTWWWLCLTVGSLALGLIGMAHLIHRAVPGRAVSDLDQLTLRLERLEAALKRGEAHP